MEFKSGDHRTVYNEILNRIFAGYIHTALDVYNYVANSVSAYMSVGDIAEMIEDLEKNGKLL